MHLCPNEELLGTRLATLSRSQLITFACACAARLRMTAENLTPCQATEMLTSAINSIVAYISNGAGLDSASIEEQLLEVMPNEDDNPDFASSVVEDALSAAVYALRVLREGGVENAVWAARRAYDTADRKVLQTLNAPEIGPDEEAYIQRHPVVQSELRRQERDVRALEESEDDDRSIMCEIVARAQTENMLDY